EVALGDLLAFEREGVLVERNGIAQLERQGGRRAAQAPLQQRGATRHPARLPAAAAALLEQPQVAAARVQVEAVDALRRLQRGRRGQSDRRAGPGWPWKGKRERRGRQETARPVPDAPRPVTDDAVPVGPTAPPAQVAQAILEGGAAAVLQVARDQLEDLGAAPLAHERFGRVAEVAGMPEVERQARGRVVELLVPPLARPPAGLIGEDHGQERRQRLEDPAVAFRDRAALLLPRQAGPADGAPDAEPAG